MVGTCGKVLIDRPVVHLQGCIASVPGESDQMVFAIVYRCIYLLNADVHCPNVERHTYFALFLEQTHRADRVGDVMSSEQRASALDESELQPQIPPTCIVVR